jgi:hypothetical protein
MGAQDNPSVLDLYRHTQALRVVNNLYGKVKKEIGRRNKMDKSTDNENIPRPKRRTIANN